MRGNIPIACIKFYFPAKFINICCTYQENTAFYSYFQYSQKFEPENFEVYFNNIRYANFRE